MTLDLGRWFRRSYVTDVPRVHIEAPGLSTALTETAAHLESAINRVVDGPARRRDDTSTLAGYRWSDPDGNAGFVREADNAGILVETSVRGGVPVPLAEVLESGVPLRHIPFADLGRLTFWHTQQEARRAVGVEDCPK